MTTQLRTGTMQDREKDARERLHAEAERLKKQNTAMKKVDVGDRFNAGPGRLFEIVKVLNPVKRMYIIKQI